MICNKYEAIKSTSLELWDKIAGKLELIPELKSVGCDCMVMKNTITLVKNVRNHNGTTSFKMLNPLNVLISPLKNTKKWVNC
jgi:hypothetical protein